MDNENKLKSVIDELMNEIAKSLHLYWLLDWIEEKLEKICGK